VRTGQLVHHTDVREGRLLEHVLYPVRGAGGRVECVAIYSRDITREHENELALKASEEKYRQLVETSNLSIFTVRRDGVFLFLNRRAAEYLGGRPADFVGRKMSQLFPAETARRQMSVIRQVIRRRRGVVQEALTSPGGEMRWFEMNIQPLRDADGKVRSALATAADMTDRKLSEEALRLSQQRLEMIMKYSRDGISIMDHDLRTGKRKLLLCNDSFAEMFGRSRKYLMARPDLSTLVRDLDSPQCLRRMRREVRAGRPARGLISCIRPDGQRNISEWVAAPIHVRKQRAIMLGIDRDVTQRIRVQEELSDTNQQLRAVVENSQDIIFQIDPSGRYTMCNRMAEKVTGYSLAELLKMKWTQLAAPEYRRQIQERMQNRVRGRSNPQPFTFELIHKSGRRVPVEMTTSAVYRKGRLSAIHGIVRDITQRLRDGEHRRHLYRRLMNVRDEERRRLAGDLHDSLGQGLVALQIALRGLAEDAGPCPHRVGPCSLLSQVVRLSGSQCERLIHEVRSICHGLYPPTLESLGLVGALSQLAGDFARDVRLKLRLAMPPGHSRLSREAEISLYRIAQEAMVNAHRHGHASRIELRLKGHNGQVMLEVVDNGRGFDPQRPPRCGLGLTSMRERARGLGGRLEIASRPGRTCLRACLPLAPAKAGQ
jgi:PAS domain S-box-containing protein